MSVKKQRSAGELREGELSRGGRQSRLPFTLAVRCSKGPGRDLAAGMMRRRNAANSQIDRFYRSGTSVERVMSRSSNVDAQSMGVVEVVCGGWVLRGTPVELAAHSFRQALEGDGVITAEHEITGVFKHKFFWQTSRVRQLSCLPHNIHSAFPLSPRLGIHRIPPWPPSRILLRPSSLPLYLFSTTSFILILL